MKFLEEEFNEKTKVLTIWFGSLRFETFVDRASVWRWRARGRNGYTVATSGESFDKRSNAERALRTFVTGVGR